MSYEIKTTSAGEIISISAGQLTSVSERGNAYQLAITLADGKKVTGYRGQSLGKPSLGDHQFYIKQVDYKEHGNMSWQIGFPAVDEFDPFA